MLACHAALAFAGHVRRAVRRRAVRGTDDLAAVGLAAPAALRLIVFLWHNGLLVRSLKSCADISFSE